LMYHQLFWLGVLANLMNRQFVSGDKFNESLVCSPLDVTSG
jgi:hypothetical protein